MLDARSANSQRTIWFLLVLLAALVRLAASCDDFWFDEIWSWNRAQDAASLWQILTESRHDNNHVLNSWIMFLLGPDRHWIAYRIPCVLAGVGTVALAGLWGARRCPAAALFAMLLTASSFPLIQYSSEARGYAYATFFAMLSAYLMQSLLLPPSMRSSRRLGVEAAFGLSVLLGSLAHASYFFCYGGLLLWSVKRTLQECRCTRTAWATLLRWHAVPLLFITWLYFVNLRDTEIGGGDRTDWLDTLAAALSLAVGGLETEPWAVLTAVVVACGFMATLISLWRSGLDLWLLYVGAVVLIPSVGWLCTRHDLFYVRYWLVCELFLLLALSDGLARLFQRGALGKAFSVTVAVAVLCGNGLQTYRLIRVGRGGYSEAVRWIAETTSRPEITVGSDHDFRNRMLLDYYFRRLKADKPLRYYSAEQIPSNGTEWVILHGRERSFQPPSEITDRVGNVYTLQRIYPYSGLSGWHWGVYHRQDRRRSFNRDPTGSAFRVSPGPSTNALPVGSRLN